MQTVESGPSLEQSWLVFPQACTGLWLKPECSFVGPFVFRLSFRTSEPQHKPAGGQTEVYILQVFAFGTDIPGYCSHCPLSTKHCDFALCSQLGTF